MIAAAVQNVVHRLAETATLKWIKLNLYISLINVKKKNAITAPCNHQTDRYVTHSFLRAKQNIITSCPEHKTANMNILSG